MRINMRKFGFFLVLLSSLFIYSCKLNKDFALIDFQNDWSHHFAYGSPSWDSFERFPNNPVYVGREGMEWPVNGFFFSDPVSKCWYLYIGEYRRGYEIKKNTSTPNFNCVVYKSSDKGKSWEKKGDLFPAGMSCYDSLHIEVPDVMVVFDQGKYHLVFDWVSDEASWQEMGASGIGYAVADSPEGPYTVSKEPIKINTQYKNNPLLGRYWRMYAPMLVKRQNDWVALYMMDRSPTQSWALAASTALKPEGPYSEPVLLQHVETRTNYPPLMEYFPAFTHQGYVYFPATSVAVNRNYQQIYRVKTEDVLNADKWELFSAGSAWHSTNSETEYAGIWGQTITGFVDNSDSIYVMFPSKNKQDFGTINLAKASWSKLFRRKGFSLSASEGASFSYINKGINLDNLSMDFELAGTMHLVWDFHGPLDIENMWGKFSLDRPECSYNEIEISQTSWKTKQHDRGQTQPLDSGKFQLVSGINQLQIRYRNGLYSLFINDQKCGEIGLTADPGFIGILLDPRSNLFTSRFDVTGKLTKEKIIYGCNEALLNSGNLNNDWEFMLDSGFMYGHGAISKESSGFAKWNFYGSGVELYLPKGPDFGSVTIYIDGIQTESINLKNEQFRNSSVVFKSKALQKGTHAIYIESKDGRLPLDCIEVINR